jgi:hypothetical protein
MGAGWGGHVTPFKAEPSESDRVLTALYTHSPAGLQVLSSLLGFDPREQLERLLRTGAVVDRQVGSVTVFALKGAMGG